MAPMLYMLRQQTQPRRMRDSTVLLLFNMVRENALGKALPGTYRLIT